ncbi:MAG TPA: helix-turn-helix domain-containing protein [Anaerovoracaceae bacterium]|nr:helix-turn-helix domain-containing protein [Anaerovoracaceae bacterium]
MYRKKDETMDRNEFVGKADDKLKLVRTEYGLNQEKMADVLGISKKTLVQIEKRRSSLGWTGAVALCTIFERSEVLEAAFGGETTDIIMALAFQDSEPSYPKTMGGKIWWKTLDETPKCKVQQNIVSQHYRILDQNDRRIFSSFELQDIKNHLEKSK